MSNINLKLKFNRDILRINFASNLFYNKCDLLHLGSFLIYFCVSYEQDRTYLLIQSILQQFQAKLDWFQLYFTIIATRVSFAVYLMMIKSFHVVDPLCDLLYDNILNWKIRALLMFAYINTLVHKTVSNTVFDRGILGFSEMAPFQVWFAIFGTPANWLDSESTLR